MAVQFHVRSSSSQPIRPEVTREVERRKQESQAKRDALAAARKLIQSATTAAQAQPTR
jgi:hypothetical protein